MITGPKPKPRPVAGQVTLKIPIPDEVKNNVEAAKEWKRIVAILSRQRILSEADTAALAIYATSYSQYKQAERAIAEHGTVILSAQGVPIKNPYTTIQNQCWNRIQPLLAEFGLTPSSRARMKLDGDQDDDEDVL
jgi:P27 family predicted phage terminase small subunit